MTHKKHVSRHTTGKKPLKQTVRKRQKATKAEAAFKALKRGTK